MGEYDVAGLFFTTALSLRPRTGQGFCASRPDPRSWNCALCWGCLSTATTPPGLPEYSGARGRAATPNFSQRRRERGRDAVWFAAGFRDRDPAADP